MCRLAEAEFDTTAGTPAAARRWLADVLQRWELAELVDTATLLASEVVTNAIRHGGSRPTVTAAVAEGILEIGVRDTDRRGSPRRVSTDDPLATGGRGLAIVDSLAAVWGTTFLSDGKQVWFRLQASHWSHSTECVCPGGARDSFELRSGRRVRVNRGPWDSPPPDAVAGSA